VNNMRSNSKRWDLYDKKSEANLNKRLAPYSQYKVTDTDLAAICEDDNPETVYILSDYTVTVDR